jgi:pimeloyl-ACP methyl ester carboxylesterase
MPIAHVNGVELYYEETGRGTPLIWSHEFGGDYRTWEPQVRYFARRYRVVTYNHRGYPPSSVPKAAPDYSQDLLVKDLHQLLKHLRLDSVHLAGCSMGANMARDFALAHPEMTLSLVMVGAGAGSVNREEFLRGQAATAAALDREGIAALTRNLDEVATRASFKQKDPRGFAEFLQYASEHDAQACAHLAAVEGGRGAGWSR